MTLKVTAARASRADEDRQNHRGRAQIRSRTRTNRRRSDRIRNTGEKERIPGEGLRDLREDVNCSRLALSRRSAVEAAVSAARSDARPQTNNLSHRRLQRRRQNHLRQRISPVRSEVLALLQRRRNCARPVAARSERRSDQSRSGLLLGEVRDSINRHETFALKHAQRQDVYSYLRARAFIRATIWNSTIFGFRTWSRRSRVCADALLWEDTMFQRRTFVGDSNAASVVCSMITCPSRRAGQFGTTADCQPNN